MAIEVDEAVYGLLARDSSGRHTLPRNSIAHFVIAHPDPIEYDGLGGYARNRTLLCGINVREGQRPRAVHIWERSKWHASAKNEHPYVCARCWAKAHKLKGEPAPKQIKPIDRADYDELPLREVVNRTTGERWLPYKIIRRRGRGYEHRPEALEAKAFKQDGGLRLYHWGAKSGPIGGDDFYPFAYYDPDLEASAQEIRQEIAMHERRLKEAKQHLLDLYRESAGDG